MRELRANVQDIEGPLPMDAALDAARHGGFVPSGASLVVLGRCARCAAG